MTRHRRTRSTCLRRAGAAALLAGLACAAPTMTLGAEVKFGARITYGEVLRVEARDPNLLTGVNAAAIGLSGFGSGGNADDANTNYARWDAASRALKGLFELSASDGPWSGVLRVKAWRDEGLLHDERPWGNVINGYAPDAPLGDAGAPRLSRFDGVALLDAWVQRTGRIGDVAVLGRVGQQSLEWGGRTLNLGGLETLNPRDLPALRRAGLAPVEAVVPRPMLFGRIEPAPGLALEAYYQTRFRPTALDMCGTLWSMNDYLLEGCDRVMSGPPQVSDRARIGLGAFQKRLPTPKPQAHEFGFGATWRIETLGFEVGLYHARYNARSALPGLRRSTRVGAPALIPGDPDGRNMAYFTEYPEGLRISAATFTRKRGATTIYGEVSHRPRMPFMLAPGDVLPPFLNAAVPALLRARADAVAPGGIFHGYDVYPMWQAQSGARHEWTLGRVPLAASVEAVGKHVRDLPNPALLRYGRADIFGVGPVGANCNVTTNDAARQCSLRGYNTPRSWGYRVRLDARLPALAPQLTANASLLFVHDVKGWSGDFLLNEGRKSLALALRFEYRQRYLLELGYNPSWGGDYHPAADRDTASMALGVRF